MGVPTLWLSQNVLSNCLSQDRSETVLRSLASSVFCSPNSSSSSSWHIDINKIMNFSEIFRVSIKFYIQIMYFYIVKLLQCNWTLDSLNTGWACQGISSRTLTTCAPGPVFYLLSWSPSHLEFFLKVTWTFSIFTLSDLEAKSLGKIPSDFGYWLGDILGRSNIVICILYLFKFIYVTLYSMFYNIRTKGSQNCLHW